MTFPKATPTARDFTLLREVADAYPGVTIIRVKDALDAVSGVVSQLATAIRGAASVALAASVLVLAGALAAGQEARLYDAVVLKTLGATRARLLAAFLLEYGILGLATAIFGVAAGGRGGLGGRLQGDEPRLRLAVAAGARRRWRRAGRHRAARPRSAPGASSAASRRRICGICSWACPGFIVLPR